MSGVAIGNGVVADDRITTATITSGTITGVTFDATDVYQTEDGITAHAGGGKASAYALSATKSYHRISVCATAADSVLMPASAAGVDHYLRNDGVAAMQVFGNGTDTINGVATATGVSQAASTGSWYVCTTAGAWTTTPLTAGSSNATTVTITDDTSTNSTMYPVWVAAASGSQAEKVTSTKFTYNPSTGALSTTTFIGALTGNADTATSATTAGSATTATTATNATNITTTDDTSTNATYYPTIQTASGGTNSLKTSTTKLSFNPSTGNLVSTKYNGVTVTTATSATLTLANSSSLITSGGNSVTLTSTGTTTVTLPTSGTLAITTQATDTFGALTDVTTNNVSATAHGFCPKFPNNTTTFLRGDGTYAAPSALTNWTEAANSSTPNGTITVSSFTATGAATNIDAAFVVKGTGSILAAIPDNTTAGGNKRGTNSVDLQSFVRGSATQVASGLRSVLTGGYNNTASGQTSVVSGGDNNVASASGSVVGGGSTNTANAIYSLIPGGADGTVRAVVGAFIFSNGRFGAQGDNQIGFYLTKAQTTNATPKILTTDQTGVAATNQVFLPNNSSYDLEGRVTARNTSTGDTSSWKFDGTAKRGANAAATALVAAITPVLVSQDVSLATASFTVTADTTNGCVAVTVTGIAATNISWACKVQTVEVTN